MKTLLIDLENGYKSIGSKETIKEKFGLPLLNFNDFTSFRNFIGQLWSRKKVEKEVKVGEVSVVQSSYEIIAKEGVDIDCMVIDTASEMSKKYSRELRGKAESLQLKQWGKLKDTLDNFFSFTNAIPANLIVNCHSKMQEDNENGVMRVMPYIEGSTKVDVGKWFDFVMYTKVRKAKDGTRQYVWVTARDEHYCHAKDRTQELPAEIPQDYNIVFDAVKKKGWDTAKVLVIGEPGSGKTLGPKNVNENKLGETMGIVVTKKEGGGYDEGWKTVVVSNAVKGDFNGSKYIDLHFEGYPETVKCRVWEARNKDGEEFSVSNMVRYINPTVLEEMDRDGTAAASLDDSPNGLKGKTLQVLFYKKANGYSEISQKVAPAVPFQNIVDNFDENRITRIKESAEKYQARRNEANGVVTETTEGTSTNGNDTPW